MTARLRSLALGVAVASFGCAARPAPPSVVAPPVATPPLVETPAQVPPEGRATRLGRAIDAALASPTFARATVSFVVRSLATDETLYARNGPTWLVPASTMKVLTAIAAADRLGWGFRFETRLFALGPVKNGVVDGDLLVVGTGDPTINRRHPTRVDAFDAWARALRTQGIRRIAGHVIGDDSLVAAPGWGIGWAWDDLVEDYGAPYAALQYNENVAEVTMGPGVTPGAPPVVYVSPAGHGFLVDVQAVTAAEDAPASLTVARLPGTRILEVRGRAPIGQAPRSVTVAVPNPTLLFTNELRSALQRHGITVDGAGIDADEETDRPRPQDGTLVHVDQSAPVSEIVQQMLAWSLNGYAESLVAALDRTPPMSVDDGVVALREILADLGVSPDTYHARDGSGLSRNDYVSADALVQALGAAYAAPHLRGPLLAALPEAGADGTVRGRLAGTAAAGRVRAKTGSMSNVRSLAGYVETIAGEPIAFAFMTNGFDVRGSDVDARVDECLQAIAALEPR